MKKRVLKTSLIILIFITAIFAIYAFMKKETTSNISASQVKQLANNSNFPTSFTISQLNRFRIPFTDSKVYKDVQLYCAQKDVLFDDFQEWFNYILSGDHNTIQGGYGMRLIFNVTYKNSTYVKVENEKKPVPSKVLGDKEAYIFSINDSKGDYKGCLDIKDNDEYLAAVKNDNKYNVVSKELVQWYIKQCAYWKLRASESKGTFIDAAVRFKDDDNRWKSLYAGDTVKVNDKGEINKNGSKVVYYNAEAEVNNLNNEATLYETYISNIKKIIANEKEQLIKLEGTNSKATYDNNNNVIINGLKMTYNATKINGKHVSGIRGIYAIPCDSKGKEIKNDGSAIKVKVLDYKTDKEWKKFTYFNPTGDEKVDKNQLNYPKSGDTFSIRFNSVDGADKYKIMVVYGYMEASGEYAVYSWNKAIVKNNLYYNGGGRVNVPTPINAQELRMVNARRSINTPNASLTYDIEKDGKYIIKIQKEDYSGKKLNGFKFKRTINNTEDDIRFTTGNGNGTVTIFNREINKNNLDTDTIVIEETSAPTGYIQYNGKINVKIEKTTSNNKYVVKTVTVKDGDTILTANKSSTTSPVTYTRSDNNGTTTITITVKNIKISNGKFDLNIKKVSAGTSEEPKSGAYFNIKKWVETNTTTHEWDWEKNGKTIKTEKKGEKGVYNLLSNVTIDKATTLYYWITETQAPTNYAKFTGGIKVIVTTGVKQNENTAKYVVKSVSIIAFDKNNKKLDPSPVTNEDTGNETTINLKMTNILKGSYELKLNKVSSLSDDSLPGATFKIQKATMNSSGTWTWDKGTEISKNANGIYTLKENVEITEAEPFDCYWITETQAPYGYNKFTGGIRVQVNKKIGSNEAGIQQYMVDSVKIDAYEDMDPNKTRVDFKGENPVTWDTKEATITLKMKNEPQYDLALRKFITSINGIAPKESREPTVDLTTLKNGTFNRNNNNEYTATYKHNKDEEGKVLEAATGDRVVYTIRIYNEGKKDGTATEITDYLPAGLKLVDNSESEINSTYGWNLKKSDSDKEYTAYTTTYLKDQNEIISAFDEKNNTLSYKDVQIECEVIATKAKDNLKNIAEITADDGKDRDSTPKNVNRGNYGSTSQQDDDDFEVLKFRSTLNLGGTVWLDVKSAKETEINGLKDSDNKDEKGLKGVNVELYQKDDTSTYTDGKRIAETTTKDDGTYTFKGLPMDKLYYVKFTYNGQNYENTIYNAQKEKNDTRKQSTATEKKQDRDNFNNGFNINDISDTELKNELGYFEDYNKLTYKNRKNQNISCAISAYTGQQSGKSFAYSLYGRGGVDNVTINTIDFGITKRIEIDMQLYQDVYAATVTVNNKTQIYGYNGRNIQSSIPDFKNKSDAQKEDDLKNWTATVTVAKGDYQTNIAGPDYEFDGENGGKPLELYVTYKLVVHNGSMSMLGEVTKIKDYYDPTYTYVKELSWVSNENYETEDLTKAGKRIADSIQNSEAISKEANESEVKAEIDETNNTLDITFDGEISPGSNKYLYLTFKVKKKKNKVDVVITGPKTNTAEIAAFKSYYGSGTKLPCYNGREYEVPEGEMLIAGRVDRDSIPNNLGKDNTPHENDEDNAPELKVQVVGDRKITGIVWEDARNNKVDGSMIGNGKYRQDKNDNGDKDINIKDNNIKIELLEVKNVKAIDNGNDLEYDTIRTIANPQINNNTFTFNNVVAGDYIVKFTYGDGSVNYYKEQSDISNNYNGQDYKTTIFEADYKKTEYTLNGNNNLSRATDIWSSRVALNSKSREETKNEKAVAISNPKNNSEYFKMTAETKKIVAGIEMNSDGITENATEQSEPAYIINGVNLGLVERPKAQLELNKTVTNVKVTLADGSILFDASKGVTVDNVVWKSNTAYNIDSNKKNEIYDKKPTIRSNDRGLIQLSMDQEIMHGASIQITYKLTVKNVGEVDYEGDQFYYTGKNPKNKVKVTTTPNTVVDYVSNNLQFNKDNNSNWEIVKLDELYKEENSADNYIDQAVKTKAQKINTIVKTNALNTALEPGKFVDTTLVLTQVITPENKNDNLTYSNIAEIVEVSNTVGRRMAFSIVGNQDPTANTPSEIDASIAEKIVILPPFGDGNIVYYILGAVVGIILIGGITLIIKKVLIIK